MLTASLEPSNVDYFKSSSDVWVLVDNSVGLEAPNAQKAYNIRCYLSSDNPEVYHHGASFVPFEVWVTSQHAYKGS